MIIRAIKTVIRVICTPFVFLRFKSIWNLKEYLRKRNKQSGLYASVYNQYFLKRGSYIGINAEFAGTPYFPHGVLGVFISDLTKIGKNAVIFQQVTIGVDRMVDSKNPGNPTIGDNAYIGVGAKIIGNIKIGNNCRIGANAVVHQDLKDNSVAVVSQTRIIEKDKELDNRFLNLNNDGVLEVFEDGVFKEYKEK